MESTTATGRLTDTVNVFFASTSDSSYPSGYWYTRGGETFGPFWNKPEAFTHAYGETTEVDFYAAW